MQSSDSVWLKRLGLSCLAMAILLIGLIIVAAKSGYFHVVQDLSSGSGDDGSAER